MKSGVLRSIFYLYLALILLIRPVYAQETGQDSSAASSASSIVSPVGQRIFIGDSRTLMIKNAVQDDSSIWACKVSMGYEWMRDVAVPAVESRIGFNTAVIILMGVNDLHNIGNYISYINQKAAEWSAKGAMVYFVSVGPVEKDPYATNEEIEAFNQSLRDGLTGVAYIDVYSHLKSTGFSTLDGTHYPNEVSIAIYHYILEHLSGSLTYRVKTDTATVIAPGSQAFKTIKIPASIKIGTRKIPVTMIRANAFQNMKKLTSVTIGANISVIGREAFMGCKRLRRIIIKTRSLTGKTVKTNAFTGIRPAATVYCPADQLTAYRRILLRRGMENTVTFK